MNDSINYRRGTAGRLAEYRKRAWEAGAKRAKALANYPNAHPAYLDSVASFDWRQNRREYETPAGRIKTARQSVNWADPTPNVCDRPLYADSFDCIGWRQCGTAEEVSRKEGSRRVEERGWYVDDEQRETVSGYVLQLPARGGVPQYVAGVAWSDRDGVTVWPNRITESALDAACWANSEAERIGEEERAYQESYQLGRDWADARQEAIDARAERRRLSHAVKEAQRGARAASVPVPALVCQTLQSGLAALLEASKQAYEKAAAILADHPYVERDAFNTGVADSDSSAEVTSPYAVAS